MPVLRLNSDTQASKQPNVFCVTETVPELLIPRMVFDLREA